MNGANDTKDVLEYLSILRKLDIFSDLNDSELMLVSHAIKKRFVRQNTLIFSKGDQNESMYIICHGSVNVSIFSEKGKELILSTLTQGDYFGELSLLDGEPVSADIVLKADSEFLVIHKDDFYRLLAQYPSIVTAIIGHLCRKVRQLTVMSEGFALNDVYERFVKLLYDLSETAENGERQMGIPLTHKDIAHRIGSSREMVSRIMKELEAGGYIFLEKKRITIKKELPSAW